MPKGFINIRWLQPGKDAVGYKIIPSATSVLKNANNTFDPATISATVVKSVGLAVSSSASEATLQWRTASNGAWATITKGAAQTIPSGCSLIEFKALVDGVAVATADVRVVLADQQGPAGPQGNKGAMPRFFDWDEVVAYLTGYAARHIDFQCGADSEAYYDLMSVKGSNSVTLYRCKQSYTLNGAASLPATAKPGHSANNKWEAATDGWGFIATKLIMAEFGIVKNLCSEYIQCVKDGVTKFEVDRNGNVTANNGTFNNVRLAGALTAKSLSLQCERLTSLADFGGGNSPHLLTYPLTIVDLDAIGCNASSIVPLALPYMNAEDMTLAMEVLVTASADSPARYATLRFVGTEAAPASTAPRCSLTTCGVQAGASSIDFRGNASVGVSILGLYRIVGYALPRDYAAPITMWEIVRLSDGSDYVVKQASALRGTGNTAASGPYAYDISGVIVRGNNL